MILLIDFCSYMFRPQSLVNVRELIILWSSTKLWAPWRWPRTEAETCRSNNQSI